MNPLIIKLGGVLLDSEEALERLFTALVNYRESHQRPLVIVHGGGCVVDELMKGLNLPVKKKNGLRVTPAPLHGGVFHTYADHRMAHAGSLLALAVSGVELDDLTCTTKTLPDFAGLWQHLLGQR